MKTIWKFPLAVTDRETLQIPEGATILTAQIQGEGSLCLWAEVDTTAHKTDRTFVVFGTGHPIREDLNYDYIATVQLNGGALVFHVYEELR